MKNCILSIMLKNIDLSPKELEYTKAKFEKFEVKKGEFILKQGNTNTYQYYVCEGCIRTFYRDNLGKEYTLQFAIDNWWIADYTSYFSKETANMNIDAIKNSVVYRIAKDDVEDVFMKMPKIESYFRKKQEMFITRLQKRFLSNLSKPAKERYLDFLNDYPSIDKVVKNYHVASYLGITTESLSRIRKEVFQKN